MAHENRARGPRWLWLLGGLLVVLVGVALPDAPEWRLGRAFGIFAGALLFALTALLREADPGPALRAAAFRPPGVLALVFVGWVFLSAAQSPLPEVSRLDALRHAGGVLVFLALAHGLHRRSELLAVTGWLTAAGAVGALAAFVLYSTGVADHPELRLSGAFRNEQLLGAFLAVLLPVATARILCFGETFERIAGQVAAVTILSAVVASRNRSSWFGGLAGLGVLGALHWGWQGERLPVGRRVIVPAIVVLVCVSLFWYASRSGEQVAGRAASLLRPDTDASVRWRGGMWDKSLRMVRDRPWLGFGPGTFSYMQPLYHHPLVASRDQADIAATGPNLNESAHNTYLQLAADLGLPGLLLYLGIPVAIAVRVVRRWRSVPSNTRRLLAAGSLGGIAAHLVSAIGSPAWEFPECSLFAWAVMGVAAAALNPPTKAEN